MSRTQQALAWLNEDPENRTQLQAASRFGIAQATIAAANTCHRSKCPTCGQKVKDPVGPPCADLASAVLAYAWHLGDCPAYTDQSAECTCGFASVELAARSVC